MKLGEWEEETEDEEGPVIRRNKRAGSRYGVRYDPSHLTEEESHPTRGRCHQHPIPLLDVITLPDEVHSSEQRRRHRHRLLGINPLRDLRDLPPGRHHVLGERGALTGEDTLAQLERTEGDVRHGGLGEGDEDSDGVLTGGEGEGSRVQAGALVWGV